MALEKSRLQPRRWRYDAIQQDNDIVIDIWYTKQSVWRKCIPVRDTQFNIFFPLGFCRPIFNFVIKYLININFCVIMHK